MKPLAIVILKVPGLLFMVFRLYLRFRSARRSYLKSFGKAVSSSLQDEAAGRIIEIQEGLMEIHFVKFVRMLTDGFSR